MTKFSEGTYAYMAQFPIEDSDLWRGPAIKPNTVPDSIPLPVISFQPFIDLNKLLEAIFALKTTNAEIYRLKALAWEIKYKENPDANNDPR